MLGVVAQWYDALSLQSEKSGGVGSIPGRAPFLERHNKGSWTRLALSCFCGPSACAENHNSSSLINEGICKQLRQTALKVLVFAR